MLDPEMYTHQPQDREEYADPMRMKRLGQDGGPPQQDPYMRRMMMAQALGGQGQGGPNMSPMGAAMGGLGRGFSQGMSMGQMGNEPQKGQGLGALFSRMFGSQPKGF